MRLDFQSDYIDLARFSDASYAAALVEFLGYKYQQFPPDVVIATTELSREFAERYRSKLFPGVPIVFIDRVKASHREANTAGVSAVLNLAGTVDLALALQPDLERVFVISGVSNFDDFYDRLAREQLKAFEGRVAVTHWSDRTLAELARDVARLPPHSAIFFLTLGEDSSGARFVSLTVRDRLSAVANAPMYAWNQVAVDHGVVGGRLFSNEIVAASSAEIALRILRGEPVSAMSLVDVDPTVMVVDWRQLRRWEIAESRVPSGATILFREPTLWDRYKVYVSGALVLFLLQSALIAGLLVQNDRRRRAETEMRENQRMLEASNLQVSELFGRLIAAQETERTRIARDLHDDVSQRIAALAIAMSNLKRRLSGSTVGGEVATAVSAMQRDTAALAQEIRAVSHD